MQIQWPSFDPQPPQSLPAYRLNMRSDVWKRTQQTLYLISSTGISLVQELAEHLSIAWNVQSNAGSITRMFNEYLLEYKLVDYGILPYLGQNGLAVVRLADFGEKVCRASGWEIKESEWGRLIRLHDGLTQVDHTGAALAFAREARLRGYQVTILPDVSGKRVWAMPDMYVVDKKRRRAYVEVEAGYHREKADKWRNQVELQGFAAVVAKTVSQRQRIVDDIKSLGLAGKAADLETLRDNARTKDPYFLFTQRWNEQGEEIELPRDGV